MKKIVVDSSANRFSFEGIDYGYAPLKLIGDGREFIDDENLNVEEMVSFMEGTSSSSTACPSIDDWLKEFEGYDEIIALTISQKLSGSYNSAVMAREEYLESHPDAQVFVVDSCQTGAGMTMLVELINKLSNEGKSFADMQDDLQEYMKSRHLYFLLGSVNNLANAGRINKLLAKAIGLLDIKLLGRATEGKIDVFSKPKGERKAIKECIGEMERVHYAGGRVVIDHVLNPEAAEKLKGLILEKFPQANVTIGKCTGLCSYYAERGGLIVGYEADDTAR